MPPRKGKEPKEQVVYAASKAKTPAYKPLRPSKVARRSTAEAGPKPKPAIKKAASTKPTTSTAKRPVTLPDSEAEEDDDIENVEDLTRDVAASEHSDEDVENDEDDDDEEGLPTLAALKAGTKKRKASAISINDDSHADAGDATRPSAIDDDPDPPTFPPSDGIPGIPQPLLLRLLHEGFAKKDTKIDKHALQTVQTYLEVFVREAIARCVAEKKEAAERGEVGAGDVGWLELEDLEKVGVGMMLDF
ncbi:putative centromere protein X [Septoria linicola]|nr:putative centromere protein X [Septoria linicola]